MLDYSFHHPRTKEKCNFEIDYAQIYWKERDVKIPSDIMEYCRGEYGDIQRQSQSMAFLVDLHWDHYFKDEQEGGCCVTA